MRFRVKYILNGVAKTQEFEARTEADLRTTLSGRMVLSVEPLTALRHKGNRFNVSMFTQELISLLDAGLSLVEAIEILKEKSGDTAGSVLAKLVEGMYQGKPFSQVLERFPEHFSALYIATVSSSERTGHLAEALRRYHYYDSRLAAVRKRVTGALVYPAVVVAIGGGIVLFLLFYVVPKFSGIYATMRNLPPTAQLMLHWGELVNQHGISLLIGILALIAGLIVLANSTSGRAQLAAILWRLPRMGHYRHLFTLTRFYRTVGLLLAGGVSAVQAMDLASPLLPADHQHKLQAAIADISAGEAMSNCLPRHELTTPVAERLLRVGEQSGELAQMCERIALFIDEDLDKAINLFTRLFEPLLMLFVGGLIGVIVFLLYMPIFELAGSMQ